MKRSAAVLRLAIALGMMSGACSSTSGNPSGTAGTSGGGNATGAGGTGTGGSCPDVTACGGSVVGTWNVTSSCLRLNATDLDISLAGLDPTSCKNVTMTG